MGRAPVLLLALALLPAWLPVRAAGPAPEPTAETKLKAAIVYNIIAFVQWPEGSGRRPDFVLCVADGDELGAGLFALDGQDAGGRRIRVRSESGGRAGSCDALYVTPGGMALLRQLGNSAVLTIAAAHGMVDQGVMVNLVQEGRRVGFDIGAGALRRAGLAASAKLLRLARYVRED
mgnify:CR=1 FL=1